MLTSAQLGQEEPTAAAVHSIGCGMSYQPLCDDLLDANDYQLTKGTIIEVNVSELGLVTAGGKVVWGRYAQYVDH
jgi:ribosomal protein S8E